MSPQPFFPGDRVVCVRPSATVFGTVDFPGPEAIVGEHYTIDDCMPCLDILNVDRWGVDIRELPADPDHAFAAERFRKIEDEPQADVRELVEAL